MFLEGSIQRKHKSGDTLLIGVCQYNAAVFKQNVELIYQNVAEFKQNVFECLKKYV